MAWSLPSIATITVRGAMTADVRIFWKRSVVYDLCGRNLYVPFPLSLTHTLLNTGGIFGRLDNFKNVNKVT